VAIEGERVELAAHTFPEHAQLAAELAARYIDEQMLGEAEKLLRRAVELDPANFAIYADLGFVLSQQHRDEEAVAIYDGAIARGGPAQLLRFNRANCKLRLQRFEEAAADLRACLSLRSDWHDARVNLVSALHAGRHDEEARRELGELREAGLDPGVILALEEMLG
jgi:tetratricopeptide (TPR) repeat protein